MVEFALVIGLFMLVVGGLVQFSVILWTQNAVTEVARETARWAVTQPLAPCDSAASRANVSSKANEQAGRASLVGWTPWASAGSSTSGGARGVGVDWFPSGQQPAADWQWGSPPIALFPSDCPPADGRIPWSIRVKVSHVVPIFLPGLQALIGNCQGSSGYCVTSSTQLRMEPKAPQ